MWLSLGAEARKLRDGETVVGSGADADWRIPTADLRSRHFVLHVHGLNASVKPSSPDSVVVLNGRQVLATATLNDGDVLDAGSGRFAFGEEEACTAPELEPEVQGYLLDDQAKLAYSLINRSTTIGRDASNAIVLKPSSVSRFHAEIRREAGGLAVRSMGTAGTRLNGTVMSGARVLNEGDVLEIAGVTVLRFARSAPDTYVAAVMHASEPDDATRKPTLLMDRALRDRTGELTAPSRVAFWSMFVLGAIAVTIALMLVLDRMHR